LAIERAISGLALPEGDFLRHRRLGSFTTSPAFSFDIGLLHELDQSGAVVFHATA
jgi:hypothetical protein